MKRKIKTIYTKEKFTSKAEWMLKIYMRIIPTNVSILNKNVIAHSIYNNNRKNKTHKYKIYLGKKKFNFIECIFRSIILSVELNCTYSMLIYNIRSC